MVPLPGVAANGREKHGKNVYDASWFGVASQAETLQRNPGLAEYDEWVCAKFPRACAAARAA